MVKLEEKCTIYKHSFIYISTTNWKEKKLQIGFNQFLIGFNSVVQNLEHMSFSFIRIIKDIFELEVCLNPDEFSD